MQQKELNVEFLFSVVINLFTVYKFVNKNLLKIIHNNMTTTQMNVIKNSMV
jgi:hypothetical protein